jgi:hypothetical protein
MMEKRNFGALEVWNVGLLEEWISGGSNKINASVVSRTVHNS